MAQNLSTPGNTPSRTVAKHRRWPWLIAVPAALVIAGAAGASVMLIAPGTTVAGVPVGWMTTDAAATAIAEKIATTTVAFDTAEGPVTLTGAELGATADAQTLAAKAHSDYPLWNIGAWSDGDVAGTITLDTAQATAALRGISPTDFVDPIEATVAFDGTSFATTPSLDGTGISLEAVRDALQKAVAGDGSSTALSSEPAVITPTLTTAEADAATTHLNTIFGSIGFYVGDERTVPVDAATAASWLSYTIGDDGAVTLQADENAIDAIVPHLAAAVDRTAVDGTSMVNKAGTVLGDAVAPLDGRVLGDTTGIAAEFAAQLESGDAKYALTVTIDKAEDKKIVRSIDVNLTEQRAYTYENGELVRSMLISSGRNTPETRTATGVSTIIWRNRYQDLGCAEGYSWCEPDVPHVQYFNGEEAFHGTDWHDNFGTPMSHGCINMTEADAAWLWDWATMGTDVNIHY